MQNNYECKHCHGTHIHKHTDNHVHDNPRGPLSLLKKYTAEVFSLLLMLAGIIMSRYGVFDTFAARMHTAEYVPALILYITAVVPVGWKIVVETFRSFMHLDFFNEYSLMLLACIGAFCIGEFPEAVAVLLFYSIGEKLEDDASDKARDRIRALVDRLPKQCIALREGARVSLAPEEVNPGETIIVPPGESVSLDGILQSDDKNGMLDFDTSAITGESVPRSFKKGDSVSSGYIPLDREARIVVSHAYKDSSMSRMMRMIEEAASRKSKSETLLRRITRYYTPAVMLAAVLLYVIPWLISLSGAFVFNSGEWINRCLVLLVCSCPCALVVSVPLSYFAAIGKASRSGMLFKGSRYLDSLREIDTLFMDKTGTLTTGKFHVSAIVAAKGYTQEGVLGYAAAVDSHSTHPLAQAITEEYKKQNPGKEFSAIEEMKTIPHGIRARVNGHDVTLASPVLATAMDEHSVNALREQSKGNDAGSVVFVMVDGKAAGAIYLSDTIKPGVEQTLQQLHSLGVKSIIILSGDRREAVESVARQVGADGWEAGLLPEDKHAIVEEAKGEGKKVAFIGDGVNDAPSLAASDIGIAIGTGGTDIAIESADSVITGTDLRSLTAGMKLSRRIKSAVTLNVSIAIAAKLIVMVLGAFGIATLWAAVFADTGITLITIILTMLLI